MANKQLNLGTSSSKVDVNVSGSLNIGGISAATSAEIESLATKVDQGITDVSVDGITLTFTKQGGGDPIVINTQDTNTDTKVKQISSTGNANYPVLLKYNTSTSDTTNTVKFNTKVAVNPSTGTITANTFSGDLLGNANTASKATNDASGNEITATYETKTDAGTKLTDAKSYTDEQIAEYEVTQSSIHTGLRTDVDKNTQTLATLGTASKQNIDYFTNDAQTKANTAETNAKTYAKEYADEVKNSLLNGAGTAYDTLKELGELIDENTNALEALELVAAGKADKVHTHTIANITNLQTSLDNLTNAINARLPMTNTGSSSLAANDDYNNFKTPGIFTAVAATGKTLVNAPTTSGQKLIVIQGYSETRKHQLVLGQGTSSIWHRMYTGSAWTDWMDLTKTTTLSDLGITATAKELNYTDGVTSNIQTQLNSKATVKEVTQAEYDALSSDKLTNGISYYIKDAEESNSGIVASMIEYNNDGSGLTATNVQSAIDETNNALKNLSQDAITDGSGAYKAVIQGDGNLVVYKVSDGSAQWSSQGTNNKLNNLGHKVTLHIHGGTEFSLSGASSASTANSKTLYSGSASLKQGVYLVWLFGQCHIAASSGYDDKIVVKVGDTSLTLFSMHNDSIKKLGDQHDALSLNGMDTLTVPSDGNYSVTVTVSVTGGTSNTFYLPQYQYVDLKFVKIA